jgi:uncharacterized protein (TIGR00299 family) protein
MTILYYDCFSGISGDMHLGAMIDIGVEASYLSNELSKLKLDDEFKLSIYRASKLGITGTKVDVLIQSEAHNHDHENDHSDHHHHHHGHQRNYKDIENIIRESTLSDKVKTLSLKMFLLVAEAEGKVHGKPIEEVHFHEVGAIDSIVDIIGSAICLDYLNVDYIMGSSVQVGGGFVKCAHGLMPVPAPATVEILRGIPIKSGAVEFETTTPTGAAILAATVESFTDAYDFVIDQTGYGLGTRDMKIPNVLRVYLGHKEEISGTYEQEQQWMIETNIDDMNPEFYSYVEALLFEQGALDVFKTQIIMKKGRPAVKLSILTGLNQLENLKELLFKETTSLGLRIYPIDKVMLPRTIEIISTQYGDIEVKKTFFKDEMIKYKPEFETCQKLALLHKVSIETIYKAVTLKMEEIRNA